MYEDLTDIQKQILEFIKSQLSEKGYPPSVREIGAVVGLASTSSVHNQLGNLEKKGYIKRDPLKQRALEVVDHNPFNELNNITSTVEVPVVGRVTAGEPILAVENIEETFPLPEHYVGGNECFMLNVSGMSMKDAGILDGDMVIVSKQNTANNGDIVVALIEDEATVKTFYKENSQFRLQPENPDYTPILTTNLQILGKVIGVIRMM